MGAIKKPTSILEARGSFKKDPQRARPKEPKGNGAFPKTPPRHFNAKQKRIWREIVSIVPHGVLTGSDTVSVEICAVMLTVFRERMEKTPGTIMTKLVNEMNKLGLSPSARAGLQIEKNESNPFDQF